MYGDSIAPMVWALRFDFHTGVDVAGGLGTVDGCGADEMVTVKISARSGRIGSVGDVVGVIVDRVGSALRLRGPRKAIQGVLSSSPS